MKISAEAYDTKVTIEDKSDDLTSTEVLEMFIGVMRCLSFSEDVIICGFKEVLENYENMRDE